jgi:antimicrobial peptide system SdpA family protein
MRINPKKLLLISCLIIVFGFWMKTFFVLATSAIPYNSTSVKAHNKDFLLFRALLPEGFSFFTRNPREPLVVLISKVNKQEIELHNNSSKYLFGFERYPRAINLEMSIIWQSVKERKWFDCETGKSECFDENLIPSYTIKSSFPKPILSGDYYLKLVEPIPWAWAKSFKKSNRKMPCKVIHLRIETNDNN